MARLELVIACTFWRKFAHLKKIFCQFDINVLWRAKYGIGGRMEDFRKYQVLVLCCPALLHLPSMPSHYTGQDTEAFSKGSFLTQIFTAVRVSVFRIHNPIPTYDTMEVRKRERRRTWYSTVNTIRITLKYIFKKVCKKWEELNHFLKLCSFFPT